MAPTDVHIEVEDQQSLESDTDSALGSETASSTTSIASSVLNYQYENGRRYHAFRSGAYVLPNDDEEQDRLDITSCRFCWEENCTGLHCLILETS